MPALEWIGCPTKAITASRRLRPRIRRRRVADQMDATGANVPTMAAPLIADTSPFEAASAPSTASDVEAVNSASARANSTRNASRSTRSSCHGKVSRDQMGRCSSPLSASTTCLPWMRWPRGVGEPDQAVLVDFEPVGGSISSSSRFGLTSSIFVTGLLDPRRRRVFFSQRVVRTRLVRLRMPANGVDGSFHRRRAPGGGRPQQADSLAKAPWNAEKIAKKINQARLAWLVIAAATGGAWVLYFHDAPTSWRNLFTGDAPGSAYLFLGIADVYDIYAGRHHARAGLHLYVSVAAHSGGFDGRRDAPGHLQGRSRRTPRRAQKRRQRGTGAAIALIARRALRLVPWASIFAMARNLSA